MSRVKNYLRYLAKAHENRTKNFVPVKPKPVPIKRVYVRKNNEKVLSEVIDKIEQLESKVSSSKSSSVLASALNEVKRDLHTLNSKIDEVTHEELEHIDQVNNRIAELDRKVNAVFNGESQIKSKIDAFETDISFERKKRLQEFSLVEKQIEKLESKFEEIKKNNPNMDIRKLKHFEEKIEQTKQKLLVMKK